MATALPSSSFLLGDFIFPVRLVVGWTYFSAFWRRLVLENKLIPDDPGYIGEKFNHFLPNAFLIKPAIEFFVLQPELLWWKLLAFTLFEAVVGLALMMGFLTRFVGIATSLLALGILLGAGWLGTTCLDEWQIGNLGIAAGIVLALAGSGRYSLDYVISTRFPQFSAKPLPKMLFGALPWDSAKLSRVALVAGAAALGMTLLTNQVFHNGVWGKLHNKSVIPMVEVSEAKITDDGLRFMAYRVEGADVYGSFLIGVRLLNAQGTEVAAWSAENLSKTPSADIANHYIAKIKPGAHSLILPLGAKAELLLRNDQLKRLPAGNYQVELLDISGLKWSAPLALKEIA